MILGENSGVQENNHESFKVSTPNLLQHNKFKKFWLAWYGNKIELFNFCESKLTFSNEFNNKHLKYVTFFQIENWNDETSVSWKLICEYFILNTLSFYQVYTFFFCFSTTKH